MARSWSTTLWSLRQKQSVRPASEPRRLGPALCPARCLPAFWLHVPETWPSYHAGSSRVGYDPCGELRCTAKQYVHEPTTPAQPLDNPLGRRSGKQRCHRRIWRWKHTSHTQSLTHSRCKTPAPRKEAQNISGNHRMRTAQCVVQSCYLPHNAVLTGTNRILPEPCTLHKTSKMRIKTLRAMARVSSWEWEHW